MTLMRHEDLRLITGQGKFTADWNLDGQCHVAVVRSPHAHARLNSINTEAALQASGVLLVLTAADVTAARMQPILSGPEIKGVDGQFIKKGPMPVLAIDRVRFVGQPVAVVVAETQTAAQDASELVEVNYEPLPAVASVADALLPDAPQLHPGVPGNQSLCFESGDRAAVEQAFAASSRTTTIQIDSQRLYGAPLEPKAVLVSHDAARGVTVVHTPTQGVLGMKAGLSAVTGIPQNEFEIISQDVGGSFGLRGGAGPEHALLVLAARKLQRPVKWVATRSELFTGEWHGRGLTLRASIALDDDDRITAIRYHDTVDLGAYNCFFGGFIGTNNLSVTMGGAYRVPALYMQSQLVLTNTVPISAYRGAGRPDIAFSVERLIDHAAATFDLDPVAFRCKNFIAKDEFPYTTANGTVYDCGDFHSVLDKALALANYETFEQRKIKAAQAGKIRGIGIGYYIEKSGAGGAPKDQVSCVFDSNGALTLHAVSGPSGQGHETAFAKIVGNGLGIDPKLIAYRAGSNQQSLVGNGTGGSRSLYGTGSAFKNLVDEIIRTATPHAATALNVDAEDIAFADGQFMGRNGSKGIGLLALAKRLAGTVQASEHPLNSSAETVTGANYPNGCHIAEVEIDPDTGETVIVAYNAIDDLGNVISPELVRGQVHGGVVQGAGQAFSEAVVYDDNGQLLSGSFMDYAMPRAGALSHVETDTFAVPTGLNELGSKGVGESGCSGSLPAISNAVMNAFASVGVEALAMPYTPARVWKHLQQRKQLTG
jgi:carbon-monoxide dehydrogenase large subunit